MLRRLLGVLRSPGALLPPSRTKARLRRSTPPLKIRIFPLETQQYCAPGSKAVVCWLRTDVNASIRQAEMPFPELCQHEPLAVLESETNPLAAAAVWQQ
jgi:hypothetical protein